MNTITVAKNEYVNIIKNQERLSKKIDLLQKVVDDFVRDEISPKYANKLYRLSEEMDNGKGITFVNAREMKKYLRSLYRCNLIT